MTSDAFRGLDYYRSLADTTGGVLIHGGNASHSRAAHLIRPWWACT